ncbi:NAD-dependent epimerase/dehydratase family protein [Novosphingobium bradum]|uniref:NAD-dependent epimerase/dehydratase family protein n=1 Tax=Novosphingobium bradum TaxID=1737444 RepID=A0ABV7IP55_9SPHN
MTTLVLGATGYLGSHLAARLRRDGPVTGFARSEAGAQAVRALGAEPLVGSLDDEALMRRAFADHDSVVWAAQLMIPAEQAFVRRALGWLAGTGKTFVMTSGTGVLSERTDGDWSENTFAEADPFVPRKGLEGRVETENLVLGAHGLRGIVVRPPAIWGHGGTAILTEIHRSIQASGAACYLGRGLNCYSTVHVEDLAELYALALARAPAGALYHAVSGELPFRVLAEEIARHRGVPARSLDYGAAREVFGPSSTAIIFAASSRSRSPRARAELGWAPSPDRLDLLAECADPRYLAAAEKLGSWVSEGERG